MKTSEQINELAAAMAKAQAAMKPAVKDSTNPAFRSKYADLTAVWDACRGPLTSHGISVWQDVEAHADGIAVTTRLVHLSGQWAEFGPLVVPLAKRDAHGVGSATSYAKRYALSAAVGIVSDDDDGNAAAGVNGAAQQTQASKPVAIPDGFGSWWADLQAVADEGIDPLRAAWKKSAPALRDHLTAHYNAKWEALKQKAEKAGKGVPA